MEQLLFYFAQKPQEFLKHPHKIYLLKNGNSIIRSLVYPVWIVEEKINIQSLNGHGICGRSYQFTHLFFRGRRAWNCAERRWSDRLKIYDI